MHGGYSFSTNILFISLTPNVNTSYDDRNSSDVTAAWIGSQLRDDVTLEARPVIGSDVILSLGDWPE